MLKESSILDAHFEKGFSTFEHSVDLIIANRIFPELEPTLENVFTRDLFNET